MNPQCMGAGKALVAVWAVALNFDYQRNICQLDLCSVGVMVQLSTGEQ